MPLVGTGGPQAISTGSHNNRLTPPSRSGNAAPRMGLGKRSHTQGLFGLALLGLLVEVDILLTYYIISDERTLNGEGDGARLFLT